MFDKRIIETVKGTAILILLGSVIAIAFILFYIEGKSGSIYANNFIQAHHTDIDYKDNNNRLIINDVYCHNVEGSSMNPTLFEGNTICFRKYNGEELKQGNIIHFETNKTRGAHRIMAVENDKIVVRGDNNKYDEIINKSDVKGILVLALYE